MKIPDLLSKLLPFGREKDASSDDDAGTAKESFRPVGIEKIDGKNFVFGLMWQHYEKTLSRREIFLKVRESGFDRFLLADAKRGSFALASSRQGVERNMKSAAFAASRLERHRNWIGFFPIKEAGFWVVGIRDGLVYPGADFWTQDEYEAREKFDRLRDELAWDATHTFEGVEIEDAEYISLSELFGNASGFFVSTRDPFYVGAAIFVAFCVFGYVQYAEQLRLKQEEMRQEAEFAEIARQRAARIAAEAARAVPPPGWMVTPHAAAIAQACENRIALFLDPPPNWRLNEARCLPSQDGAGGLVTLSWRRIDISPGPNYNVILGWIAAKGFTVDMAAEGEARTSVPLENIEQISVSKPEMRALDVQRFLRLQAETWGGSITFQRVMPQALPPVNNQTLHQRSQLIAASDRISYTISGYLPPIGYGTILFMPGLTIDAIEYAAGDTTLPSWTTRGHVFLR